MEMQEITTMLEGLEEAQRLLARSDQNIDQPYDAIGSAIQMVGAVGALHTMLFDYEKWVREHHPGDQDDDGSSFAAFDEQRADWYESIVRQASVVTGSYFPPKLASAQCCHCERDIELAADGWIDPEATGDDSMWRETCDANDSFDAKHEPITEVTT